MIRLCTLIIGGMLSVAFASEAQSADPTWFNTTRPVEQVLFNDGGVVFFLEGADLAAGLSCGNRFFINMADPNYEAKVSLILTTYMSQDPIDVLHDPDDIGVLCSVPVRYITASRN